MAGKPGCLPKAGLVTIPGSGTRKEGDVERWADVTSTVDPDTVAGGGGVGGSELGTTSSFWKLRTVLCLHPAKAQQT